MDLSDFRVTAAVAVSDIDRAREFYEGKLGLSSAKDQADGGCTYSCADGTRIHIYPSAHAGSSRATVAAWIVEDVDGVVDELTANGVTFEQYGDPFNTDERGIARLGPSAIAWFKDPDGNTLAIENE